MKIKKAVVTAAARNQNTLPLQTLVDRDGVPKSALRIILEEVQSAGVDDIGVVICPGDRSAYAAAAGTVGANLRFIEQTDPRGYGHALLCARSFVGNDPFLHLVGDHLYLSRQDKRCAQQLAEIASTEACPVSAVQATRETMLPYYGAIGGKGLPNRPGLYVVEKVLEKPTPTEAEQQLIVPGLRSGHYLCFFGMHVLTPALFDILARQSEGLSEGAKLLLSPALAELAARERYLACDLPGRRYNMGVKFGVFVAQLALGLAGSDREEVLAQLLEVLANRQSEA